MIPCKYCLALHGGKIANLKGLKQVGKTRYTGPHYERRYRCQDCGAMCTMRGTLAPTDDEWSPPQTR